MTNSTFVFDTIADAPTDDSGIVELPLLPVRSQVVLPYMIIPVPLDYHEIDARLAGEEAIHTAQTAILCNWHTDQPDLSLRQQIELVGTEIAVLDISEADDPMRLFMVQGRRRVEILDIVQETPFPIAKARVLHPKVNDADLLKLQRSRARYLFDAYTDRVEIIPDDVIDYIFLIEDDSELCDMLASTLPLTTTERQQLLEEPLLDNRFSKVARWIQRELDRIDIQDELDEQVNDEISRVQREMYLREQMRLIQDELEETILDDDLEALSQRLNDAKLPPEANTQATRELNRLAAMPPASPEAGVIRTYLEWLADLPWQTSSDDNLSLAHADDVLSRNHHGLDKIKERVLEHIAVRKLAGDKMRSPIICFVGPPGVGKTSLGKSIAIALGREFVRVSLGGVRDEAEIRGHRRTYIGAMPGRIIQTMKRAGTRNPVFMLDEIDKIGDDYRGDPAAALLEVLDPEQNDEFSDHYLEVSYDLSDVLFIATANDLYPLPEALEDRMEIIEFHAYTEEEKLQIAKKFLVPKQLDAHGLSDRSITFQDAALKTIIQHYTLEAGVRNLEREIGTICRKLTRRAAENQKHPKRITTQLVEKYLGAPYIIDPLINRDDSIGLTTGLVWTSAGGDIQLIEAALLPGKGNLILTGQLGDVLQESAQIAFNYMRSRADDLDVPHEDFEEYDIHIHMPEGGVPKDGPSAGITLTTAIISAFTERKIRSDFAMTGEVTLRGHVLPVGGIKEKVLAARRYGIPQVILPADNEKDLVDIPKQALKDIEITFVRHMQDVMDILLLDAPAVRQRDLNNEDNEENSDTSQNDDN